MRLSLKLIAVLLAFVCCSGVAAQTARKPSGAAHPAQAAPPQNDCLGYAQHPDLRPGSSNEPVPTVTFRLEMATFDPKYYGIAVESTSRAAYVSEPLPSAEGTPGDPYLWKFVITDDTRQRIFDLARQADFFKGDFDYKKGNIANTGAKTLSYAEGGRCNQTTFNYSANAAIAELTRIFQAISSTLEFGRRLAYEHRFDKLGLDAELKSMEEAAKREDLLEVQAIEPVLKSIASDYAVMHLARSRAERMLARVRTSSQSLR